MPNTSGGWCKVGKDMRIGNSAIYATPLRLCPKARAKVQGRADCDTTFYCTHTVRLSLAFLVSTRIPE